MNRTRHAAGLLRSTCLLSLFFLAIPWGLEYSGAQAADGSIVFYTGKDNEPPGDPICTLAFTSGDHSFPDIDNCSNDEARWFKLVGVPSATYFTFYDHPSCEYGHNQNFVFKLKTVKNNLTMTEPVSLESLRGVTDGAIVPGAPGVRMESKDLDGGNDQIKGKLSCVKITRSPIPE